MQTRCAPCAWILVPLLAAAAAHASDEPAARAVSGSSTPGSSSIVVGDVRVQALSPTLLRVEPKGPAGFEDRSTFMVVNRSFAGLAITKKAETAAGTLLSTSAYDVLLRRNNSDSPSCGVVTTAADVTSPTYSPQHPNGAIAAGREACCLLCDSDAGCVGWLWKGDDIRAIDPVQSNTTNCWPLSGYAKRVAKNDCANDHAPLEFGCSKRGRGCGSPSFRVTDHDGTVLYDSETDRNS